RVMDPVTQRMMGMRADMTVQVARIASTRLSREERPLRLSYAGDVLRVKGSQLRPDRQFIQAGLELIGCDTAEADAEVILIATRALVRIGVPQVCVDLTLPPLVPLILDAAGLSEDEKRQARHALDHKDAAEVAALPTAVAPILGRLLQVCGPFETAFAALAKVDLPPAAAAWRDRLSVVAARLRSLAPDVLLSLDVVENRGFEYHTGLCFTFFAPGWRGHLGRGGRYGGGNGQEPATGASLYLHALIGILPKPASSSRVLVPLADVAPEALEALHAEGFVSVCAVEMAADWETEAVRLNCTHLLKNGRPSLVVR
ncbi:MAG: ATP phosphoribosyltransferase regulatory subunit, partial [Rhodospirillaceae bacterium]|nr:ATP phosphoribosyltransferase regulatory subunit [Rhodospirillaceae bacterium]